MRYWDINVSNVIVLISYFQYDSQRIGIQLVPIETSGFKLSQGCSKPYLRYCWVLDWCTNAVHMSILVNKILYEKALIIDHEVSDPYTRTKKNSFLPHRRVSCLSLRHDLLCICCESDDQFTHPGFHGSGRLADSLRPCRDGHLRSTKWKMWCIIFIRVSFITWVPT